MAPELTKSDYPDSFLKQKWKRFVTFAAFSRKCTILRPNLLFGENPVLGRISRLFGQKVHFSGSGPPKHLPEPYVYVGFYAGGPEVGFWAQKCTSGLRNAKNGGIPLFLLKFACHLTFLPATWKMTKMTILGCENSKNLFYVEFQCGFNGTSPDQRARLLWSWFSVI